MSTFTGHNHIIESAALSLSYAYCTYKPWHGSMQCRWYHLCRKLWHNDDNNAISERCWNALICEFKTVELTSISIFN